jgi:hypothetical protein
VDRAAASSYNALMNNRWLVRLGVLCIFAAFAVWLEPTRVVLGALRGEAFYQGRPTSWWANELGRWDVSVEFAMMSVDGEKICRQRFVYARDDTAWEAWWKARFPSDARPPTPAALTGDPAAETVLTDLTEHPTLQVRRMAEHGLDRLRRLNGVEPAVESAAGRAAEKAVEPAVAPEMP